MSDDPNVKKLSNWWAGAKADAATDKEPVNAATLYGGKAALKWTALVPLAMAVGYLLLILYFRARGGYRQVHIEGTAATPSAQPAARST